jgi:hypothetical protein
MSQRQRRRKDQRRNQAQRSGPSKRQVAAGATIAMGATLAAAGSAQAATFTVSNLNDTGPGSLRQAVLDSNSNGNSPDSIVFASGLSGTIDVGSFNGDGLYPGTPVDIQGPGADKLTLRGVNGVGYVVFTGSYSTTGYAGEPITLSGLTITGGNATSSTYDDDGGGIFNSDAHLAVSSAVISGNHADDDAGGIYSYRPAGSLTLVNTTVSGNSGGSAGDNYGGGIFSHGPVSIRNSTISGNTVGGDGGGIYMSEDEDPSLTIENSTIANNSSTANSGDDEGGGVWVCCGDNGQQLKITSSTITGNRVGGTTQGQGGGVYNATNSANQVTINNTIVANNTGTKGNDVYLQEGGLIGFSLIKDTTNSTDTGYSLISTGPNIFGVDPQLGPLANNGGATQTEALGTKSPAIDKGSGFGLTSDQRGVLRPIDFPAISNVAGGDGSDIGAFELQPSNKIRLGKLKRNKANGTGKQVVKVPLPAAGTLTVKGKGLKTKTAKITKKTKKKIKLPVIPKGSKRAQENATGSVKLKAKITYKPTGNVAKTLKRKLKLLKS